MHFENHDLGKESVSEQLYKLQGELHILPGRNKDHRSLFLKKL